MILKSPTLLVRHLLLFLLGQNQYLQVLKYEQHHLKLLHLLMIQIFFFVIEVFDILEKLDTSKSSDVDRFANEMIEKKIATEIAEPLTLIFNIPFARGWCLSGWKKALVRPLRKKVSKSDFRNYRSISITFTFLSSNGKTDCKAKFRSFSMTIVFGVLLNMVFENEYLVIPYFLR